jgi:hypothetical protein
VKDCFPKGGDKERAARKAAVEARCSCGFQKAGEIPPFDFEDMMKIYTASFWEPEVHGPGRKISISPSAPKNLKDECGYEPDFYHEFLSPDDVLWDYYKAKKAADNDDDKLKKAGEEFVVSYQARLGEFKEALEDEAKDSGKTIQDLIGFEDGDTLLSWERGGHLTYRTHVAEFLRGLGYEVEER